MLGYTVFTMLVAVESVELRAPCPKITTYSQPATMLSLGAALVPTYLRLLNFYLAAVSQAFISCRFPFVYLNKLPVLFFIYSTPFSISALVNRACSYGRVTTADSSDQDLYSCIISSNAPATPHPPPSKVAICFASRAKKGWFEAV